MSAPLEPLIQDPSAQAIATFEAPTSCKGSEDACEQAKLLEQEEEHQQFFSPRSWIYRAYWNAFEMALGELGWTPMSVLDAGCGDATLLSWIAKTNRWAKLYGLDFTRKIIDEARKKHPCRIQYKVVSKEFGLPYPDQSMDLVVSHAVLPSHIQPGRFLQEMCRVSKEVVILSTIHPLFYKLVQWQPLSKFWHLNHRERIAYYRPEWLDSRRLGDDLIRLVCFETGFQVEWEASPWPFKIVMLRHPQRKKNFKAISTPEMLPEDAELIPDDLAPSEAPVS